ncbi:titin isoform X2 [Sardina pilchardus]|uniref:titin isoform X2 n=1 Tax=Sardina pilchardus TaxID=27697 RepID=UPI002E138AB9
MAHLKALLITGLVCLVQESKSEELPTPKLTVVSGWTQVFPAEEVTMKCDIQPASADWTYQWHRDGQEIGSADDGSYSITSTQTGLHTCVGVHKQRTVQTKTSNGINVKVFRGRPKPKLTKDPASVSVFYTTESVSLKCEVAETTEGWTYLWYKDNNPIGDNNSQHTLTSVVPADGGSYWCRVERDGFKSERSDSLSIVIKALPETKLVMQTKWTKVFPSEVVKMKCDIQPPSPDWICKYYRNDKEFKTNDCVFDLQSVKTGDSGVYKCSATHRSLKTQDSNPIHVHVYDHQPKLSLSVDPNDSPIYTKEKVTLTCHVQEQQEGWTYMWYKDSDQNTPINQASEGVYSLPSVQLSHNGQYKCQVKRGNLVSEYSDSHRLTIEDPPVPKLERLSKWAKVFPTEEVRMKCNGVPSSPGWTYKWHRELQPLNGENADTLFMGSVDTKHNGRYTCQGVHKRHVVTVVSDSISIHVYDHQPKPLLSVYPNDPPIYTKENVTLICHVQEEQEGWTYMWYKDSDQKTPINQASERVYSLPSVQLSHNGQYKCQVKRGNLVSEYSDSHGLTIEVPPVPKLEQLSKWAKVFPTEEVRMKCNGIPSSPRWTYKWHREQQSLGDNTDTLLMDSVDTKDTGNYTCQGVHKRHVQTVVSDSISIHVYGNKAKPTLSVHPIETLVYVEEQVTFTCEVKIDSTDWEYQWFQNNPQEEIRKGDPRNMTYTIQSASGKDGGEFRCKTTRGAYVSELSTAIQIKILPRPTALVNLETGWADILSVDSLTLLCEVDNTSIAWNYTWYKDRKEIANETKKELHIKATKENYRSEYSCKGIQSNRPTYSMLSDAFIANNIVLKRQILLAISGCLVVGFVLIVLGCIYFKFTRKPEEESKPEPDLFFSMAELKKRADIVSTTELCIADTVAEKPLITEKTEDVSCLSDELLKEAKESQNEEEANGLQSFKGL